MIPGQQLLQNKKQAIQDIPSVQKFRYALIILSCFMFLSPFLIIPTMLDSPDMCGKLCMRRFYLYFASMTWDDVLQQMSVASTGVMFMGLILITTLFFGRLWCGYLCPMGGLPELVSRLFNDRMKIDYRPLPQTQIRYGYFAVYVILMPSMGISACTLCNFITIPRIFEAFSGGYRGFAFLVSSVGLVNLCLLFLLGFFANKGRAYCQFMCPIGAIDGLVNRAGAHLPFSRRIRVQQERCTGCKKCAQVCMTGSIEMKDGIAIVDQFSCMSCYDCVESCEWGAIDWITKPVNYDPVRKKKGVEFFPTPEWTAVHPDHALLEKPVKLLGSMARSASFSKATNVEGSNSQESEKIEKSAVVEIEPPKKAVRKQSVEAEKGISGRSIAQFIFIFLLTGSALFFGVTQANAAARNIDPDGCLTCHALTGLDYIDADNVLRSASINEKHYYSSLHGSVPCLDCHRETRSYPHKVENTEVDCAASCHVEEPSEGKAYDHQFVVDEFSDSIHGAGWSKGFTGGNRLEEIETEANPSCRWCHSNTLYIEEHKMALFKTEMNHTDEACGNCHQGEVWRGQFGGHILRRLVGARWDKQDTVDMCVECHDNDEHLADVKQKDALSGEEHPVGKRYLGAAQSYAMTLHARLLEANVEEGASCNDCHAPTGYHHGIHEDEKPESPTHIDQLGKTCGAAGCHAYAGAKGGVRFSQTDMHDMSWLMPNPLEDWEIEDFRSSAWNWAALVLIPLSVFFLIASFYWSLFIKKKPKTIYSRWGGEKFKTMMLGMKNKAKKQAPKSAPKKSKPKPPPKAKPEPESAEKKADENKETPDMDKQKDNKPSGEQP